MQNFNFTNNTESNKLQTCNVFVLYNIFKTIINFIYNIMTI